MIRIHRDVPPIVFANVGTDKDEGAIDGIAESGRFSTTWRIPSHYIHADVKAQRNDPAVRPGAQPWTKGGRQRSASAATR